MRCAGDHNVVYQAGSSEYVECDILVKRGHDWRSGKFKSFIGLKESMPTVYIWGVMLSELLGV